jgi:hypothetical protein
VEDISLEPRTNGAIALYPIRNLEGTWAFFNLNTNRVVKRNHWTSVPLDQSVVDYMNDLVGKQKRQLPRDVSFCRGVTTIEDLDEDNVVEVEVDDQDVSNNPAAEMRRRAEDVVADKPPEYDNDYAEDDLDSVSVRSTLSVVQLHQTVEPDINVSDVPEASEFRGENVPDEVGAVDEVVSTIGSIEDALESMSAAALNPEPRYNLRPTRPPPGTWSSKSLSHRSFGRAAIKAHTRGYQSSRLY